MATTEESVSPDAAVPPPEVKETKKVSERYIDLSVKEIVTRAGDNVRSGELPEIEQLAKSIAAEGVLAPILVTPSTEVAGKYTVVAGHRRLTAVRSLGLPTIPARVIDANVDRRLTVALTENIQREDMTPLDKAKAFAKLLKNTKLEQQEVAEAMGVAPGYVSQYIALLELPESALSALRDGEISFTQARALCRLLPNTKAIDDLVFEASDLTVAALDSKIAFILGQAKKAEAAEEEDEDDDKPKKAKKAKAAPTEEEVEYYVKTDFHPMKKDEIRDLMVQYKRKEVKADTAAKREEFRLILKGITLAANLRLK